MTILKHSPDLLLVKWIEEDRELKMLVRKYTRDLLVFSEIFFESGYLSHLKSFKHDESGDVRFIVDAGANIGCSAIFLHALFPKAKMVCVEPEFSNFGLLLDNIKINNASANIFCINKALWHEITSLQLMQRDWSNDAFHVMQKPLADEVISMTETITFSELFRNFNVQQIDFLKLDIEGAEKVFFDDDKQLEEFLPYTAHLAMEVHEEFISGQKICDQLSIFNFNFLLTAAGGDSSFISASRN